MDCTWAALDLSVANPTAQEHVQHHFQGSFIASLPPSTSSLEKHKILTFEM
jgi:hypothetical protein